MTTLVDILGIGLALGGILILIVVVLLWAWLTWKQN